MAAFIEWRCPHCGLRDGHINGCLGIASDYRWQYYPPQIQGEGTAQCTCNEYPHTATCGISPKGGA